MHIEYNLNMADEINKIEPTHNDVLKGRGKGISRHPGNFQFRNIINGIREQYALGPLIEKEMCAKRILNEIQQMDPPGRFLSPGKNSNEWVEISGKAALAKIRQALREGAPDLLKKRSSSRRSAGVTPTKSEDRQDIACEAAIQLKEGQTEEHIGLVSSLDMVNHELASSYRYLSPHFTSVLPNKASSSSWW